MLKAIILHKPCIYDEPLLSVMLHELEALIYRCHHTGVYTVWLRVKRTQARKSHVEPVLLEVKLLEC